MRIKKMLLLIISINFLAYPLYAEEQIPKDKPGTAVFVMKSDHDQLIDVTGDIIYEQSEGLEIDMKIPVLKNIKNKLFQKRLNYKIRKHQLCYKNSIKKDAIRYHQYAKSKGLQVMPYILMTNYHIKSNDRIFSLETTIYDYRGGAHGLTTNTYYNIDVEKPRLLEIKDLFKENSDYKKILNDEIYKQIKQREVTGEIFFHDQAGFTGINDDQAFYIDYKGNLVIVFGLYEIAPYAAGIIEFHIPNKIIDNIRIFH